MKIVLFLADGFEEVEALTVVDYLRRMEIEVDMVSITNGSKVKGAHNIEVTVDKTIEEFSYKDYDGVILPGGMPGASNLRDNNIVIETVKYLNENNKLIGAICAAPIVLAKAKIIKDKNITSYPGFEDVLKEGNYIVQGVVVDGNTITGRGPAYAVNFAIEIVNYLLDDDKAIELMKDILYKE